MLEDVLKIDLPDKEEDTLGLLTDGVILCNFLNHLKPRSVPLIHVPSPQVRVGLVYVLKVKWQRAFINACSPLELCQFVPSFLSSE